MLRIFLDRFSAGKRTRDGILLYIYIYIAHTCRGTGPPGEKTPCSMATQGSGLAQRTARLFWFFTSRKASREVSKAASQPSRSSAQASRTGRTGSGPPRAGPAPWVLAWPVGGRVGKVTVVVVVVVVVAVGPACSRPATPSPLLAFFLPLLCVSLSFSRARGGSLPSRQIYAHRTLRAGGDDRHHHARQANSRSGVARCRRGGKEGGGSSIWDMRARPV